MYGNPEPDFTVPFKSVTIEGGATLDIEVDVYLPASTGDSASLSNAVLYIHGGAMVAMDKTDIPIFLPRYAKSNHLVLISTNYRLAPQGKVQEAASDCIDAAKWCESDLQKAMDEHASTSTSSAYRPQWSGKLAIMGGSAGGWLTLLVAAAGVPSIKAAAAIYPMTNLSDPHFENPMDVPAYDRETVAEYIDGPIVAGAEPDLDYETGALKGRHRAAYYMASQGLWRNWLLGEDHSAATLEAYDARRLVHNRWPPTFLLHGAGDTTIPPTNSQDMAESLKKSKVEHVLRLVPEKPHFFDMLAPQEAEEELGITDMLTFLVEQMEQ
ncbi:alpha/beta-hydrolase [Ceraceosorus guamensis]|uniref:Alpha/beta-hydrolase n=1 Tax=Ceraceosorus guamensis TaxID=1522189 RepID=A0A316VUE3_9BASI|nr:alpha/beta-hydrolase [Ceraceosorus guamensis]PWN41060.1 alpha/beta-hydrolase [Ceraceosorus guamensis]